MNQKRSIHIQDISNHQDKQADSHAEIHDNKANLAGHYPETVA